MKPEAKKYLYDNLGQATTNSRGQLRRGVCRREQGGNAQG